MEERELTPKPNVPKLDGGGKPMPDEVIPPEERPEETPEEHEETSEERAVREARERRVEASRRRSVDESRRSERDREERRGRSRDQEEDHEEQKQNYVPKELVDMSKYLWLRYLDKNELTDQEEARAKIEFPPTENKPNSGATEVLRLISDIKNEDTFKEQLKDGMFKNFILGAVLFTERVNNPRVGPEDIATRMAEYEAKIQDILDRSRGISELKSNTLLMVNKLIKEQDEAKRNERGLSAPKGVRELALDIMYITGQEFGRGGKYALLKYEGDEKKEVFHPENFLRWVRDRMVYYHKADPDNPNINLNAQVNIFGTFRDIAIQQMIDNPAFFTDEVTGKYYNTLRDQVIYELWLFGQSRGIDAFYRQQMGSDVELPKMLSQIYQSNAFTKQGTLSRILTLMNVDEKSKVRDFYEEEAEEKERTNQQTGQALRHALLAYFYMSDTEMLNKITTAETAEKRSSARNVLFNNRDFVDAYVDAQLDGWLDGKNKTLNELSSEEKADYERKRKEYVKAAKKMVSMSDFFMDEDKQALTEADWNDPTVVTEEIKLFRQERKREMQKEERKKGHGFDEKKWREDKFKDHINVFNNQEKDIRVVNETKERIKLLIREKHGISYKEADYAETFAYSMTRWTGIGAMNDTGSVGFDAWTKVLDTQGYRERQSVFSRAGVHGNPYSFAGIKRLGASFVFANDKSGKSIIEWIQGGQGEDIDLTTEIKGMSFGERAMQAYAANHINRSFNLFTKIIDSEEFNFDKFTKIDGYGRVIFDPNEAGKVIDGVFKDIRYAYCTYPDFDYSKKVRVRTREWDDNATWTDARGRQRKGRIVNTPKTVSLAEMLWGDQILENMAEQTKKEKEFTNLDLTEEVRKPDIGEVVQSPENRVVMWKEVLKYLIAAEVYAHRDINSPYRRFTPAEVEKIFEFLSKYNFNIEANPFDFKKIERLKGTFNEKDIKWMRSASSTQKAKMISEEVIYGKDGAAWGFFGGLMKAAQLALSNATKAA